MDRETCHKLELVHTREWLETDGRGGYASSTPLFAPSRRYHGLYVVTPEGHTARHVLLSRFDESLHVPGHAFALSIARYPGRWAPHGHQYVESFELCPWPRTTFLIGGARVVREVLLARGRDAVLSRYSLLGDAPPLELRLRPMTPYRRADHLTHENIDLDPRVERIASGIRLRPYPSLPALSITHSAGPGNFEPDPVWYRNLEFTQDLERGYEGHEDQFSAGFFHLALTSGAPLVVAATAGEPVGDPSALWAKESAQRLRELEAPGSSAPGPAGVQALGARLALTADAFLYRAHGGRLGVIAGFPWYGERGRDTFLALPGLLLSRGRVEECGEALCDALAYLRGGRLPAIFGNTPELSTYGPVDVGLWFARAVRLYDLAGGTAARLRERLLPALREIACAMVDGGVEGARLDDKGTLFQAESAEPATWMDSRGHLGPWTPRHGAAVETNALWYFLQAYLELAARADGNLAEARQWETRRRLCTRSFLRRFWLEGERRLADLWRPEQVDTRLRPNMVIAAALEFSPLSRGKRTDIVRHARAELVTPRGLRSLAPFEKEYLGSGQGSLETREEASHQGTAWPWLSGFYCEAYLRAYGRDEYRRRNLEILLAGFAENLDQQGLGFVSESFDGDPPHRPRGAVAQACSSAEILRALALLEEPAPGQEASP